MTRIAVLRSLPSSSPSERVPSAQAWLDMPAGGGAHARASGRSRCRRSSSAAPPARRPGRASRRSPRRRRGASRSRASRSGSSRTSRSGLPIGSPSFPSRKERFCWSDEAESGPKSIEAIRPGGAGLDRHRHHRRLPLHRADPRERPRRGPPADLLGLLERLPEARAGRGVLLGPPAVRVLHRRLRGEPEVGGAARPLEAVGVDDGAQSTCVSAVEPVAEMMRPSGSAARAPASIACAHPRRRSASTPAVVRVAQLQVERRPAPRRAPARGAAGTDPARRRARAPPRPR